MKKVRCVLLTTIVQLYSVGGQHNITLSRRTFFRIILKWNRVTLHQQPGGSVVTFSRPEQTFNIHSILEIISCQREIESILRKFIPLSEMYQQVNEMCQHSTTNISNAKSTFWDLSKIYLIFVYGIPSLCPP